VRRLIYLLVVAAAGVAVYRNRQIARSEHELGLDREVSAADEWGEAGPPRITA
jgi:hypothetical protein